MESLTELHDPGDAVAGEKLIAVGRKISKVHLIPQTSAHRAQAVYVWGKPARCFIDISIRLKSWRRTAPQRLKWRDPLPLFNADSPARETERFASSWDRERRRRG